MRPDDLILNGSERRLVEAARAGAVAEYGERDDPVRAEVVAALAARLRSDWPVHHFGVRLRGGRIEGSVDLGSAKLDSPLELIECVLSGPLLLIDAQARTVRLTGTRLPGLDASRMSLRGALLLDEGFHCRGEVRLWGASIEGVISAEGAFLDNAGGASLDASWVSVSGGVFLSRGSALPFRSRGTIVLVSARIGGGLSLEGADLENPEGIALVANGLRAGGALLMRGQFRARGEIRLRYADIEATLECDGSIRQPGGTGLDADGIRVGSNVFLREGFHCVGEVRFSGAQIGGSIECSAATFENPGGIALEGRQSSVGGSVVLGPDFRAAGSVSFLAAKVGGVFVSEGSLLKNPEGVALMADGLTTRGPLLLRRGFHSVGVLSLLEAEIGSRVEFDGSTFENPGGAALDADGIVTRGTLMLRDRFHSKGMLKFLCARIGGTLEIVGATLENPGRRALWASELRTGDTFRCDDTSVEGELNIVGAEIGGDLKFHETRLRGEVVMARAHVAGDVHFEEAAFEWTGRALSAQGLTVGGSLFWRELATPPLGLVSFADATVGRLADDGRAWPAAVRIENFTYNAIAHDAPLGPRRLEWLRRQSEFSPQPYEQAVAALRRMGQEKDARRIAIAKHVDLRRRGRLGWPSRLWSLFLGATVGHGYQVWRALVFLLALFATGASIFGAAHRAGFMLPAAPGAGESPVFEPLVYSIDVGLPIIDLHQERHWVALKQGRAARPYRLYFWLHISLGWFATTLAVTGLTGLIKKE